LLCFCRTWFQSFISGIAGAFAAAGMIVRKLKKIFIILFAWFDLQGLASAAALKYFSIVIF